MKLIVFLTCALIVSSQAHAMQGTTKGGQVACLKKEWYQEMVKFVTAGDKGSFQAYVDSKKCIIPKAGLKITITESPGMFGGTAGFVYQGIKLWTAREALEYGQ